MFEKPIDAVGPEDVAELIANRVREGRSLDYKEELPAGTDDARRDFLGDVASLANTVGGCLLFGVSEERDEEGRPTGLPSAVVGLEGNLDAEMLKLESCVRDGIEPRVPGVRCRVVTASGRSILLCWIPRSWQAPHMVTFKNLSRFYARAASGKYQLDVQQIRAAFIASESLREGVRAFRQERLAKIVSDEAPLAHFLAPARIILHVVPLAGFDPAGPRGGVDLTKTRPLPLFGGAYSYRYNFDGVLGYDITGDGQGRRYVQVFRNGTIEAVDASMLRDGPPARGIPSIAFEREILKAVADYLRELAAWGVPAPVLLMLSLVGVRHYGMATKQDFLRDATPIDRDSVIVPEVWLDQLPEDPTPETVAPIAREMLDVVWQAAGWPKSPSFDDAGSWRPS